MAEQKPIMTTIGNRPAKVTHLHNIEGTFVQCKLPNGEEAYVPLQEIYAQFKKEMIAEVRSQTRNTGAL